MNPSLTQVPSLPKCFLMVCLLAFVLFSACGPKAFVKGQYDSNIERENLLTDQWSETDMQKSVTDLVSSMLAHPSLAQSSKKPIVLVTKIQNKTNEHVETQSIADMIKVELTRSGKVVFIDKEAREDIANEQSYQESGAVGSNKIGKAQQVGADFILNGRLDSIVQEVGKDKTVYYKLTLNLTDIRSGLIVWTDHKQMRKVFRKKTIGL